MKSVTKPADRPDERWTMTDSKGSLRWWAYPVLAVGFLVGFPIAIVVVMAMSRFLLLPSVPILHWPFRDEVPADARPCNPELFLCAAAASGRRQ
jgi:hypothetical protein